MAKKAIIIGAGPAGLTAGLELLRRSHIVPILLEASDEILSKCIELGGSVTGEHGIGVEKISFMDRLFSAEDLNVMRSIRDCFNPTGRCSPGKMLPVSAGCGNEAPIKQKPGRRAAM